MFQHTVNFTEMGCVKLSAQWAFWSSFWKYSGVIYWIEVCWRQGHLTFYYEMQTGLAALLFFLHEAVNRELAAQEIKTYFISW